MRGSLQEKNNKYYAVFRVNGKQKWVNLGLQATKENQAEAERELQKILEEYSENKCCLSITPFIDYLDIWLQQVRPLIKPSTYEGYEKVINGKVKPYFKNKHYRLRDLRGMHFTQYFVYLKEQGRENGNGGLSRKAVVNIRGVLSSALTYAVENDLIHDNVIEHSRLPIFEKKDFVPVVYNAEQIKLLLDYAEKTESKACLFLYLEMFTGCRKGELLALTWDNVNFDNGTIHICQNRTGSKKEVLDVLTSPKTKNGVRTLPLPPKVLDMLQAEHKRQKENRRILGGCYKLYDYDYVIRQADGSLYNPNSINRIIRKMTDKLGLPPCRIHDYRHAVASLLFDSGAALSDVTVQLGHGQTSTTERIYVHRSNVANVENMRTLTAILER